MKQNRTSSYIAHHYSLRLETIVHFRTECKKLRLAQAKIRQEILGVFLRYFRVIDPLSLVVLISVSIGQLNPGKETNKVNNTCLDYLATCPNGTRSDAIIWACSHNVNLDYTNVKIRVDGSFYSEI